MTDRRIPLAAAICAVLQPASVALAQQAPEPTKLESVVVTATRREVEPAGRRSERDGALDRRHRQAGLPVPGRCRRCIAERHPRQRDPGAQRHHHARDFHRHRRVLHGQPGRGLSRRPADDVELAAGRRAADRHRAHRGAAGSAGDAVRVELAIGHDPLRHQQAGSFGLLEPGRRRNRTRPRAARRATTSAGTSTFPSAKTSRSVPSASMRARAVTSTTCWA